ncbi:MAG: hypothetical protein K2O91_26660, partial [Lachnospiraceae bacterium]|nr:hypothetical protein [Lachnospiraceae bacterium]
RFHLHQNLMEAVSKILGREIPSTIAVPSDDETDTPLPDRKETETDKKIPCTADSLTSTEAVRLELVQTIQKLYQQGTSVREIARITGKVWKTVQKYLEGDPEKLCRNNRSGCLDKYKNFIIQSIRDGIIQSKIIEQLMDMGYERSKSNAQQYIKSLVRELGLKPENTKAEP